MKNPAAQFQNRLSELTAQAFNASLAFWVSQEDLHRAEEKLAVARAEHAKTEAERRRVASLLREYVLANDITVDGIPIENGTVAQFPRGFEPDGASREWYETHRRKE